MNVLLKKGDAPTFGLSCCMANDSSAAVVTRVVPGGVVAKDNRIQEGDLLLAVDEVSTKGKTIEQVQQMFFKNEIVVKFQKALRTKHTRVQLTREDKATKFGMQLGVDEKTDKPVISQITPGSLADNSDLEVGMFIHRINGKPVDRALLSSEPEAFEGHVLVMDVGRTEEPRNIHTSDGTQPLGAAVFPSNPDDQQPAQPRAQQPVDPESNQKAIVPHQNNRRRRGPPQDDVEGLRLALEEKSRDFLDLQSQCKGLLNELRSQDRFVQSLQDRLAKQRPSKDHSERIMWLQAENQKLRAENDSLLDELSQLETNRQPMSQAPVSDEYVEELETKLRLAQQAQNAQADIIVQQRDKLRQLQEQAARTPNQSFDFAPASMSVAVNGGRNKYGNLIQEIRSLRELARENTRHQQAEEHEFQRVAMTTLASQEDQLKDLQALRAQVNRMRY